MTTPLPRRRHLAAAILLLVTACGGSSTDLNPDPDPDPGGDDSPVVAAIDVTSPIDTVIAVGRTAQLQAVAHASDGSTISGATFTWSSSDAGVASINGAGLVTAASVGRSVFSAAADGVTGTIALRSVDADLDASLATLVDPFAVALRTALSSGTASTIASHTAACESATSAGNVLAVDDCLSDAIALSSSSGDDRALLAVHDLFAEHARRLLNLGG